MRIRWLIVALGVVGFLTGMAWADGPARGNGAVPRGGGVGPVIPGPVIPGRSGATGEEFLGERHERNQQLNRRRPVSGPLAPPAPTTPRAPARPAPQPADGGEALVHLHHGSVRMLADLARVDLTLEVQNVRSSPIEWRKTYAIDPAAEVIGAVLRRANEPAITARTLTATDAQRIYAQIRTPPPTRTPRGNRDPLLLQRTARDRLLIAIWPVEPSETIRVELTFVTPLRGRGAQRTYVDVMGGPSARARPQARASGAPDASPPPPIQFVGAKADWLLNPGELVLSSAPAQGMTLRGEAGGLLHYSGRAATEPQTPRPTVTFLTSDRGQRARMVGGASYRGRIVVWRFDPQAFLAEHGYETRSGLALRLVPLKGNCKRLAPDRFGALDEPRPVTALMVERGGAEVRYAVEVVDATGFVVERYDEAAPIHREQVDPELEAAVSGWHRAAVVRRVFRWAGAQGLRRQQALRFAVDMGVLVAGSSALAVPQSERRRLTPTNRRLYDADGEPLGAARHEADLKAPPRGSLVTLP